MRQEDAGKLQEFVEATKAKGATDEFLVSLLVRQGWPQDDVYSAIGSYWERATGIALPQRTVRGESSRDAFLYLLSFSTLATWASALGSLLFRFIDRWFPDPVSRDYTYNLRSAVTWQMASIAVAFPIFLLVMAIILREAQGQAERLQSSVRKWLTYCFASNGRRHDRRFNLVFRLFSRRRDHLALSTEIANRPADLWSHLCLLSRFAPLGSKHRRAAGEEA